MNLRRDVFRPSELHKVNSELPLVLASGGPLLTINYVVNNSAFVIWNDEKGNRYEASIPIVWLRRLVPITREEIVNELDSLASR